MEEEREQRWTWNNPLSNWVTPRGTKRDLSGRADKRETAQEDKLQKRWESVWCVKFDQTPLATAAERSWLEIQHPPGSLPPRKSILGWGVRVQSQGWGPEGLAWQTTNSFEPFTARPQSPAYRLQLPERARERQLWATRLPAPFSSAPSGPSERQSGRTQSREPSKHHLFPLVPAVELGLLLLSLSLRLLLTLPSLREAAAHGAVQRVSLVDPTRSDNS